MSNKKSTSKKRGRPKKLDLSSLVREGLKRQAERDEANSKLSVLESEYERSKKVWRNQEDQMLRQISYKNSEIELLQQELSNVMEVISGLGEILGENKSEIKRLRLQGNDSRLMQAQSMYDTTDFSEPKTQKQ